jgi:uncharacterized protein (TIGR02145 family)
MTKLLLFASLLGLFSCTSPSEGTDTAIDIISKDTVSTASTITKKEVTIVDSVLTDERDQQQYKIKRFENLWWMIENLNYDIGDSLFYRDTYIGMAGYCLDNKPENCEKHGRLYDLPAAMKACPKGWRIPNMEEWVDLNEKHANCTWDKASITGNYRDSVPDYQPLAGSCGQWDSHYKKVNIYPIHNLAYYWAIHPNNSIALKYKIDMEKCHATLVQLGSTRKILAQGRFLSCRCVQEAN